ncbi:MAG: gamma-glutamyltransferase, partial [Planctomycetota bacterium]
YLATEVGAAILQEGGNAIDAAVAASLALAVCEPAGSGIGGMAVMMVHLAKENRNFSIEGACTAPESAHPDLVAASHRYLGYRAVAVPGYIAALDHALENYGSKSLHSLAAPAIRLAEEGFLLTPLQAELIKKHAKELGARGGGAIFLDRLGSPRMAGDRLQQPALARTLRRLARDGLREFYAGETARLIAADMQAKGGFVSRSDLAGLRAREGRPLTAPLGKVSAQLLGPPGGGLSLGQLMYLCRTLETEEYAGRIDLESPQAVVLVAAMIQAVRSERRRLAKILGATHPGPVGQTLSEDWARDQAERLMRKMRSAADHPASMPASPPDSGSQGETSHLSVMDREGNAVALTQSVERSFGSMEMTAELGFLYNGYLRAFKVKNREHPHYLRKGTPARSNAAPTILLEDGRPKIVIGATGSERMISTMFSVLLRLRDSTPFSAVAAPRIHSTPEGLILWEAERFPPDCRYSLLAAGFTLQDLEDFSFRTGGLQLVCRADGVVHAVADPRRDGAAACDA